MIKQGNKVSIGYEGRFEDGKVFDSSTHGEHSHPLIFEVGAGNVIPGFEKSVIGMKKGDEKEFSIDPKEAYGEYREELKQKVSRDALPKDQEPKEGMILMANSPDGIEFPVQIVKVDKENVTLDMNHPLAGKKLIFKIRIVEENVHD